MFVSRCLFAWAAHRPLCMCACSGGCLCLCVGGLPGFLSAVLPLCGFLGVYRSGCGAAQGLWGGVGSLHVVSFLRVPLVSCARGVSGVSVVRFGCPGCRCGGFSWCGCWVWCGCWFEGVSSLCRCLLLLPRTICAWRWRGGGGGPRVYVLGTGGVVLAVVCGGVWCV